MASSISFSRRRNAANMYSESPMNSTRDENWSKALAEEKLIQKRYRKVLMCAQRVNYGYLESESAPKSQKGIQKNQLKEKLSQKRSGKILHGGFLLSQLSPVRRKKRLPGGSWPWENPWTPAIRLLAHSLRMS